MLILIFILLFLVCGPYNKLLSSMPVIIRFLVYTHYTHYTSSENLEASQKANHSLTISPEKYL